jgi:hypothetical protein
MSPARRPVTAQAEPEPLAAPADARPSITGASIYRVMPADGSAQLAVDYDGGHFIPAGTVLRLVSTSDLATAIGAANLTELPLRSLDLLREQTGRGGDGSEQLRPELGHGSALSEPSAR